MANRFAPQVFDHPTTGDRYTIAPLTPGRLTAALDELHNRGLKLDSERKDPHASMIFAMATASVCLVDWKRNSGGALGDTTKRERDQLILDDFDAITFISEKANELASKARESVAGDEKN